MHGNLGRDTVQCGTVPRFGARASIYSGRDTILKLEEAGQKTMI